MLKIFALKNIISQNKPFFKFLIKFLLFYVVFAFIYKAFLFQYDVEKNEIDFFTEQVANQTFKVMQIFSNDVRTADNPLEPSVNFYYKEKLISRIIEGCNAVSVMILFASFVFAFSSNWRRTFLFIVSGVVIIHVLNVVRITLLTFAFYYYPNQKKLLHDIVFPLFIYGVVFILWILWVTKFSGYVKTTTAK